MLALRALRFSHLAVPLKAAFGHASHTRQVAEPIIVEAEDLEGRRGYGEIQPRAYVTGETHAEVLSSLGPAIAEEFAEYRAESFSSVLSTLDARLQDSGRALASWGGVEGALLDLAGQIWGVPLARVLDPGATLRESRPQGIILGFEVKTEELAKRCAFLRLGGRKHVKLKIGREDDEERLLIVGRALPEVPLRLDANEAYDPDGLLGLLRGLDGRVNLHSVEQPVAAADHEGLARIRREGRVRVMVDESLVTLADLEALISRDAVDVVNLRLGKCGGWLGTARLAARARAAGLELHLGTMVGETGILTRQTEVFSRSIAEFPCIDGKGQNHFLLAEDVLEEPRDAERAPLDSPGLGVKPDPARIARLTVGAA